MQLINFPSYLAERLGGSMASSAQCRQPLHNGWSPSSSPRHQVTHGRSTVCSPRALPASAELSSWK